MCQDLTTGLFVPDGELDITFVEANSLLLIVSHKLEVGLIESKSFYVSEQNYWLASVRNIHR